MEKAKEPIRRILGKEIGIIAHAASMFLRHQFREYEIGHAQLITLHYICRRNGLSQNELVQYSNLDKSSITSQLNKLEEKGYISRQINADDSRGRRIFITEKTQEIEEALHEKFISWNNILTEGLEDEELEQVLAVLDKVKINAQRAIDNIRNDEEQTQGSN